MTQIASTLTPEGIVRQLSDVELGLRLAGVFHRAVHVPAAHVDDPGIEDLRPAAVSAPLATAIGLSNHGHNVRIPVAKLTENE